MNPRIYHIDETFKNPESTGFIGSAQKSHRFRNAKMTADKCLCRDVAMNLLRFQIYERNEFIATSRHQTFISRHWEITVGFIVLLPARPGRESPATASFPHMA